MPSNYLLKLGGGYKRSGTCRATWYVGMCGRVNWKIEKIYNTEGWNLLYISMNVVRAWYVRLKA